MPRGDAGRGVTAGSWSVAGTEQGVASACLSGRGREGYFCGQLKLKSRDLKGQNGLKKRPGLTRTKSKQQDRKTDLRQTFLGTHFMPVLV